MRIGPPVPPADHDNQTVGGILLVTLLVAVTPLVASFPRRAGGVVLLLGGGVGIIRILRRHVDTADIPRRWSDNAEETVGVEDSTEG